ncbi:hypothetical protein GTY70_00260 [Stenotrophomonas maltophilia]|uniref:hypothetical protein n=1 Tax=Stenotrophomonas pavanii TaxID=487698 RepID=UPI001F33184F|nr:hypothetical protein [Stenotrophomonas pavanii]MCF3462322.1 hypothetical protein [Stenotrophomonas maltophilia]MCF3506839.1 hypothetical protein [Stenotrophomonas maltophilia]MCU1155096.1 hypothetical protein [Stenotrophomonas maltophilia]MCU1165852.1 hypothetical protein [Stenotrophomonas maltophilia]MCU1213749.1 hypothetical protein [Stenotrophomonas maltophilia]
MRIQRPFIFIASLALMAWCGLMGVLVLIHGFNEYGLRCGRLCSLETSIRLLFGHRGFEILVAMGLFATALMCGYIALREGLHGGPRRRAGRRGRRHRRPGRPRS